MKVRQFLEGVTTSRQLSSRRILKSVLTKTKNVRCLLTSFLKQWLLRLLFLVINISALEIYWSKVPFYDLQKKKNRTKTSWCLCFWESLIICREGWNEFLFETEIQNVLPSPSLKFPSSGWWLDVSSVQQLYREVYEIST